MKSTLFPFFFFLLSRSSILSFRPFPFYSHDPLFLEGTVRAIKIESRHIAGDKVVPVGEKFEIDDGINGNLFARCSPCITTSLSRV